jgi:hypothetical protein
MGHYHLNLQAGDPNVQKQATQVGMASSIIYPITLTNRSKYVYLTNQNKTPLTSDQKQSRWQLLQENNSLSLEPPSKYDQHSTRSDTSPRN